MPLLDIRDQAQRRNMTELLLHMNRFTLDLKITVGMWCLSPSGGRYHERYRPAKTIPERLQILADLSEFDLGLAGVEAQYPYEVNEDTLHLYRQHEESTGQRLVAISPNLHNAADYEFGSLTNPDPRRRKQAIETLVRAMRLTREAEADLCVVWPGIDGYENPFGLNFTAWRDRLADALVEAMEEVPGVRVGLAPNPHTPRGRQFVATVSDALIMAARVESRLRAQESVALQGQGHAMVTVVPDSGHLQIGHEDVADSLTKVTEQGRLAHTRWSSKALGNSSLDLDVGVVGYEQLEAALYALKMNGYTGMLGLDIHPQRIPVKRALRNSVMALRAAHERVESADHEHILECTTYPEADRGWIEAYLNRRRAPDAGKLPKLGPPLRGDDHLVE